MAYRSIIESAPGFVLQPPTPRMHDLGALSFSQRDLLGTLLWSPRSVKVPGIKDAVSAPTPNRATFRRVPIRSGSYGTKDTLGKIAELAVEAASDPFFIDDARSVVAGIPSKAYEQEAQAILSNTKGVVDYRDDPIVPGQLQWLMSPGWLLFVENAGGNCASLSACIAARDLVDGKSVMLKAIAADADQPGIYSHVYPVVLLRDRSGNLRWFAQDAVGPGVLGWEPPESSYSAEPILFPIAI